MSNQVESSLRRPRAYYALPPLLVVYGPPNEIIEQDGYRPAGENDFDDSFPLRDSYYDTDRPEAAWPPVENQKRIVIVVTSPHDSIVLTGGVRLRE